MEHKAEYLQSRIDDRRKDYLSELDLGMLQHFVQDYSFDYETGDPEEETKRLVEIIIDNGIDIKNYGNNYWIR